MFIGYACVYSFAIASTIAFTSLASVSIFIINPNSFLLFLDFYLTVVKALYYGK